MWITGQKSLIFIHHLHKLTTQSLSDVLSKPHKFGSNIAESLQCKWKSLLQICNISLGRKVQGIFHSQSISRTDAFV